MSVEKIKTRDELSVITEAARASGKNVGFTNGCFDIIHLGHVRYLADAKKLCEVLVVGVNSDDSVKRIKGDGRPVNAERVRMEVLSALESVDYITMFDEDTPEELIRKITPDVLFKGGDWKEEDIVGADHVKARGGKVKVIPYVEGFSTTGIIERMKK